MKKLICHVLLLVLAIEVLFPTTLNNTVYAVTDTYDFEDPTDYTISDSTKAYIHGGDAKLKGSLTHRGNLENGPVAMDWGTNVIVDGNYAYITGYGAHAVTAVDISDPTNMSSAGYIGANGNRRLYGAYDLIKVGNYIYVASYTADSLEVIDATNPLNLKHHGKRTNIATTKLNGARGIDVVGNFAYVASYLDDALQIIDISNPGAPVERGYIQDLGGRLNGAMDVSVVGDYAYVSAYVNDSIQVVDISDPDAPVLVGEIVDDAALRLNGVWGIEAVGNLVYVASNIDDALVIIDVTDPTNPVHTGSLHNSAPGVFLNGAREIEIVGDYAYISANVDDSLEIIDISDPTNPSHVGVLDTPSINGRLDAVSGVTVDGTDVYMASYANATLQSIDATALAAPVFQGELESGPARLGNPIGILVDGDYAYIAGYGSNSLEIVDISDSSNPTHAGSISDNSTSNELYGSWDVVKKGDYVYVSGYSDRGLETVDVSDPTNPVSTSTIVDSATVELQNPRGSYIEGNYLYVVSYYGDSLQIFDISAPAVPVPKGFYKDAGVLGTPNDVAVSGNYAYISDYTGNKIVVVDVSDPNTPVYETEIVDGAGLELRGAWDLRIDGDILYVVGYTDDSIVALDISDPTNITYLGDLDNDATMRLRRPRGIVYDEGYAYLSTYSDDSVVSFDVSDPTNIIYIGEIRNTDLYDTSTAIDKKDNDLFFTQYLGSSMAVVRESYPNDSPYIIPNEHIDSSFFNSMTLTLGTFNEGDVSFQLSNDDGVTWYYYNGANWIVTAGGTANSNDVATLNTNIAGFNTLPGGTDEIKWKAFLNSDGSQKVEIDKIVIDYFDISPPIIDSSFPTHNDLMPKHDFDITFDYFDVDGAYGSGSVTENNGGIGVDIATADLELYRWDGTTWGSDIAASYITFSGSIIGTGSASYPTHDIPFGKYKMDFNISDLNTNMSSTGVVFYVDEPEFMVSTGVIDIHSVNSISEAFSDTVTLTVKTVGAPFSLYANTTLLPAYGIEGLDDWDGTIGYGYEAAPFSGVISTMGTDQLLNTQTGSINTNGDKNIYTYDMKLGALVEALQAGGDYEGEIDFGISIDY